MVILAEVGRNALRRFHGSKKKFDTFSIYDESLPQPKPVYI